ncbi:hypothetical protein NEUTE1DRAFT_106460 [Neurospora tetrasperma FGSC 2508]|uniref:Uncharacterized protein n=1 Tax=Neurospora tetrasperma (strain FGSC 2508 / ATCC MYA-4615 / P0657) TaxID=510951 RepID=F8N4M1_NEUT8|nr:uncharacterized protein NEUTE1DRAFT_106460 [Neurospora tetrasperma FGSC 2508]EGO53559.1 hypothetical protein NEUTE1DRAFT_106460 [Neurospora tetrasperma FGSC 2508]
MELELKKAPGVSSDGHEELAMCGAQEHSGIVRCIDGGRESIIGFLGDISRTAVASQDAGSLFTPFPVSWLSGRSVWTSKSVNGGRPSSQSFLPLEGRKEGSWHWAAEALIG